MRKAFPTAIVAAAGVLCAVPAHSDEWGCTVLLCLANPEGPQAAAECVDPIHRLWEHLRHGRPFPSCEMSDGSSSEAAGAYVRHRYTYYDPCPSGTTDLGVGVRAAAARDVQGRPDPYGRGATVTAYATGIGTGEGVTPGYAAGSASSLPPKVCVGTRTAAAYGEELDAEGTPRRVPVEVYDHVVLLKPNSSPRVIDVYIDDTLYKRVRW